MTWEEIAGNWKEFKGRIKQNWGKLNNDELEVVDGEWDQLVGTIQAHYALTKVQAEREVEEFCSKCSAPQSQCG